MKDKTFTYLVAATFISAAIGLARPPIWLGAIVLATDAALAWQALKPRLNK